MKEQLECSAPTTYDTERAVEFLRLTLCHSDIPEDTRIDENTLIRLWARAGLSDACDAVLGEYANWLDENLQANTIHKSVHGKGHDRIQSIVKFLGKHNRRGGRLPKFEYTREAFGCIVVNKEVELAEEVASTVEKSKKSLLSINSDGINPTTLIDELEFVNRYSDVELAILELNREGDITDDLARCLILFFNLQVPNVEITENVEKKLQLIRDTTVHLLKNKVVIFRSGFETTLSAVKVPVDRGVRHIEHLLEHEKDTIEDIVEVYKKKGMSEEDAIQLVNGRIGAALIYLYSKD